MSTFFNVGNANMIENLTFQGGYRGPKQKEYFSDVKGIAPELERIILSGEVAEELLEQFLTAAVGVINPKEFLGKVREFRTLASTPGMAIRLASTLCAFSKMASPKVFNKQLETQFLPLMEAIFKVSLEGSEERLSKFSYGAFRLERAKNVLPQVVEYAREKGLMITLAILRAEIQAYGAFAKLQAANNPHIEG